MNESSTMTQVTDPLVADDMVSLTLPRKVAADIVNCSPHLADRLHYLLQRNGDGPLAPAEQSELEALVDIAQVKQLIAMALEPRGTR